MAFTLTHPKEDQHGNPKENIFLAFDEKGAFLGHSYVYPNKIHQQIDAYPYLIYMDVQMVDTIDACTKEQVHQALFDRTFNRALTLREQEMHLKARIYTGFEPNDSLLNFYTKNGFREDYIIKMEATINNCITCTLPPNITAVPMPLTEEALKIYENHYNSIFVSPLNCEAFKDMQQKKGFESTQFYFDGNHCGSCVVFQKDGIGYIDTLFLFPKYRNQGIAKIMLQYVFSHFIQSHVFSIQLDVWALNQPAVSLYESFGFKEISKTMMFPGISL